MQPHPFHHLSPLISAIEREAPAWFAGPVDAVTPEHHVERGGSDLLLLRVHTRGRIAGVSVRVWRVTDARVHDRDHVEERVRREFQETMECWQAFDGVSAVGCVRPLACFPEHLAIATEEAPGRPLSELLQRVLLPFASKADRLLLERACHGLAAWLHQFRRVGQAETSSDAAALMEYIDTRLRGLVANPMAGFSEADRARVLFVTEWLVGRLQPEDLIEAPIHGELTPARINIDPSHLTVLDCTPGRRGLALYDLASVCMHIGLFTADHRYSAALIRDVQRRFLHAFDQTLDAQRPAMRVALLVNVVTHYAWLAAQRTASVAALSEWHVMRRHRSWLRRLESGAAAMAASR